MFILKLDYYACHVALPEFPAFVMVLSIDCFFFDTCCMVSSHCERLRMVFEFNYKKTKKQQTLKLFESCHNNQSLVLITKMTKM